MYLASVELRPLRWRKPSAHSQSSLKNHLLLPARHTPTTHLQHRHCTSPFPPALHPNCPICSAQPSPRRLLSVLSGLLSPLLLEPWARVIPARPPRPAAKGELLSPATPQLSIRGETARELQDLRINWCLVQWLTEMIGYSDAFQRRERASEDMAIRLREKEKLLELRKKLTEQQQHLQRLSDHMLVFQLHA